jgi:glycerol-3-phosphate dehydrogenase (NAD(P)+)
MWEQYMKHIVIIGAGYMGSAMAWPLRDNGHLVKLVGTHLDEEIIAECQKTGIHPKLKRKLPDGILAYPFSRIDEAMKEADIILSGVNSSGVHWIANVLKNRIRPGQTVLGVTKGLEITAEGIVKIFPQIILEAIPSEIRSNIPVAAIGGPCIAGELAGRRQTCVVFGAYNHAVASTLADVFRTSYYHIWPTEDIYSLEVSVALKNFFALAVGTAYGFLAKNGGIDSAGASMHNLASALFAEGTWEIAQFLKRTGGNPEFAYTLPGAGDLYVTTMGGRSVRMGRLLGEGYSFSAALEQMEGETLEAVEIIRAMSRWLASQDRQGNLSPTDFPLMRALVRTVVQGQPLELKPDQWFREAFRAG